MVFIMTYYSIKSLNDNALHFIRIYNNFNYIFLLQPLVVKPDQLIKRRGKLGLIAVNKNLTQVKQWVKERLGKDQKIGNAVGKLRNFIIEPFIPHKDNEEAYVCIYSHRSADTILFYHQGGVDIGDVDSKAVKLDVPVGESVTVEKIEKVLLTQVDKKKTK